jgi:hypothetical protein
MAYGFAPRRADRARTRPRFEADQVFRAGLGNDRLSPVVSGARCGRVMILATAEPKPALKLTAADGSPQPQSKT